MNEALHEELVGKTEEIRGLVAKMSTYHLVMNVAIRLLFQRDRENAEPKLSSPVRQCQFLMGLMLSQDEPNESAEHTKDDWLRICTLLEDTFRLYGVMYFESWEAEYGTSLPSHDATEVAMPAFLHYFCTGLLATTRQLADRIRRELLPLDAEIAKHLGMKASIALEITEWIGIFLQGKLDSYQDALGRAMDEHEKFVHQAKTRGWTLEKMRTEAKGAAVEAAFFLMSRLQDDMLLLRKEDLQGQFANEDIECFWNRFTTRRGREPTIQYMTDPNPCVEKPLILVEPCTGICPGMNFLYAAIEAQSVRALDDGGSRESFLRLRDKALEESVAQLFMEFLGSSAGVYRTVFDTADLQHEHDIVITFDRILLIIECKASPPVEPFRDPERALTRIRRAFCGDRGIQKAFDQANRLRRLTLSSSPVLLYDSKRQQVCELNSQNFDAIHCICVTRDDFGPLAIDLKLLLKKDASDPYPWAVNVLDLDAILEALKVYRKGPPDFFRFLDERTNVHGRVICSDELEIAGFFLRHGTLLKLPHGPNEIAQLVPHYADVFDEICEARLAGRPAILPARQDEPVILDTWKEIRKMLIDDKASE